MSVVQKCGHLSAESNRPPIQASNGSIQVSLSRQTSVQAQTNRTKGLKQSAIPVPLVELSEPDHGRPITEIAPMPTCMLVDF